MNKVSVKTRTGDILIGYVVEPKDDFKNSLLGNLPFSFDDSIFLQRKTHLTVLAKDEIVSIRPAHDWETEKETIS
ncbi:MAG TPA: hypothetical protein VNM69_06660 [Bacillus sp. (in: firmicutes)]|nr:hypothetical protein [Bacillus sp. (in: firmicutes)]